LVSFIKTGFIALFIVLVSYTPLSAQQTQPTSTATVQDLEGLAAVMKDPTAREQLLARIETLIAAQKSLQHQPAPESVGSQLIAALSENIQKTSQQLVDAADVLREAPILFSAIRDQVTSPGKRRLWIELFMKVVAILIVGGIAEKIVRVGLGRPRRSLEERQSDTLWVRLPLLVGRTVLDLVPVIAFATAAYLVAPVIQASARIQVVALTLINAYLIIRLVLVAARMVLAPVVGSLRVVPMTDMTANYLFIWIRRLTGFAVFGYFFAEAARLLGLPAGGHTGLLHLLGLLLTSLIIVFLLQNRASVATWIRGNRGSRRAGRLRDRMADIWHVLAILYVLAIFAVWILGIDGGFQFLSRATVVTGIILIAAKLITTGLDRAVQRGFAISQEVKDRFPTLEERANRYLPAMRHLLRWLLGLIAAMALLETWGINALGLLETPFGKRLAESFFSITTVIILSLIVWEAINTGIERYLTRTDSDGNTIERSARIRTLLPLFRKVVFTVLAAMVVLITLSELGINIAPLLAGAGVIGLAVGFGAQTLVKDIITGLFILVEDTIAVGDYVDVGGHEGTVESLSIRTIRLRDPSATVHTVPFSNVGPVLNYTKDFSIVVLNIGVAYRENIDHVMQVVEDLGREVADDPVLSLDLLAPLEVQGLQSFDDSAVVIRARIKVRAGAQWTMKRAFNRRLKNRFDELGIEIPFPQRTVWFAPEKAGDQNAGVTAPENKPPVPRPAADDGKSRLTRNRQGVAADGDIQDGGDVGGS